MTPAALDATHLETFEKIKLYGQVVPPNCTVKLYSLVDAEAAAKRI